VRRSKRAQEIDRRPCMRNHQQLRFRERKPG
jgi:hypothetical protein